MITQQKKVLTKKKLLTPKKVFTKFRVRCFSRHPSHRPFRNMLPLLPFRSIIRLGSSTPIEGTIAKGGKIIELNSIQGVRNSANKKLMKECFQLGGVKTADWFLYGKDKQFYQQVDADKEPVLTSLEKMPYPIIAKNVMGSRGTGNYKLDTQAALTSWLSSHDTSNYIFERFYNYSREYRLHITEDGCFYTCRKMLKKDCPDAEKWQRHDDNCVWIVEENPDFDKPVNWKDIVTECVKAADSLELDICCFDVKVQGTLDEKGKKPRSKCDFILIESGSAPSMGEITLQKYLKAIPELAMKKAHEYGLCK